MEISNSLQSTNNFLLNQINTTSSEKIEEEKEESKKVEKFNTTSKLYRELSEDMSKYATANPTQDKIDKDLMNILSKYEDGGLKDFLKFNSYVNGNILIHSKESRERANEISEKLNIVSKIIVGSDKENRELMNKYGYELYGEITSLMSKKFDDELYAGIQGSILKDFDKDEFEKTVNYLSKKYGAKLVSSAINDVVKFRTEYDDLFLSTKAKNWKENVALSGEYFAFYDRDNKEDMAKLAEQGRKGFQNTYRLSDEFAKTEKFDELYEEYKAEGIRLHHEASSNFAWDYLFDNDFLEIEKALIIKKGRSKSEWIESIDKSKTLLEDMLKDTPKMKESIKIEVKDSIEFYENILTDLKELWKHGNFEAKG